MRKKIYISNSAFTFIKNILNEEGLDFDEDAIYDAIMRTYISNNPIFVSTLHSLYSKEITLQEAVANIFIPFYENCDPSIVDLKPLVKWAQNKLDGIPFANKQRIEHGDFDPCRPQVYLQALYRHLEEYNEAGKRIDALHNSKNRLFENSIKGECGESPLISDPTKYNLYASGWYAKEAEKIKAAVNSPTFAPSEALTIFLDHWDLYWNCSQFYNTNQIPMYCVLCAESFPSSRKDITEFRRLISQIKKI